MKRSFEKLNKRDLRKLLRLALHDINSFFERNPRYRRYQGTEKLVALCQGAALHYVDGRNGIKDFDVWFFYPDKGVRLPYRRRGVVDFGPSRFGKQAGNAGYQGRSIDVLFRSDRAFNRRNARSGIVEYLSHPKSDTPRLLAKKAVVGLYPEPVFGEIMWPVDN
ncbi:hypothetical protein ACFL3Y_01140 [Pseudomonadota bacterium]